MDWFRDYREETWRAALGGDDPAEAMRAKWLCSRGESDR
jgi:hypothetical protein